MKSNNEYLKEIYEKKSELISSKEKDEFYNIRFKKMKKSPLKIAAMFVITLGLTIGVGYCGTVAYQKIWKEPKKYTFSVNEKITEDEKEKCISAEEANKKGNEYLKQVGLEGETIINQNLEKEFLSDKNEWWMASKIATITIDAESRRLKKHYSSNLEL